MPNGSKDFKSLIIELFFFGKIAKESKYKTSFLFIFLYSFFKKLFMSKRYSLFAENPPASSWPPPEMINSLSNSLLIDLLIFILFLDLIEHFNRS